MKSRSFYTLLFLTVVLSKHINAQTHFDSTSINNIVDTNFNPSKLVSNHFENNLINKNNIDATNTLLHFDANTIANAKYFNQYKIDSLSPKQIKKRVRLIATANVVGYSGILVALSAAWYKNYPKSKFHFFDDHKEWLQVDKTGHMFGAYIESKASSELWKWTGIKNKTRIWLGGLSGAVYQTVIETLDGFSAEWGWSWSDFAANILGSGTFIAQELAWNDQRIKLKWSFHRKNYRDATLNQRSDAIFGKSSPERFLKDYNGQTYWASAALKDFFPNINLPRWLALSVGYGAEGMFGAFDNIGRDKNGNIIFDRSDISRYRQWYIAPDIDFSRIKTKHKGIKLLFTVLNAFKFPLPSFEFSRDGIKLHALHF